MKNRNLKFFKKARAMADFSDFNKICIGCIIVHKNREIGSGYNTYKTHPIQMKYDKFRNIEYMTPHIHALHAEIMALTSIKDENVDWNKVEVYIYRKMSKKPFGMSRPCPACMMALKAKGVKHIYYTSNDGLVYENISDECIEEVLKDDAV